MNFPDYNNLVKLQKHMLRRPNLQPAVMVGAGMSLNSEPLPGIDSSFPNWEDLSRLMFYEIYPLSHDASRRKREDREERFHRSNALRIASEYEAAFGPGELNSFILESIPDDDHQPGVAHELLKTLPWKDIFTTNFDTLLERTYVPEKPYRTVQKVNELTGTESPRIIKLHGSYSTQGPFIITEEDYRTYPKRFAPFVNTVLQSLIENPFVLIGFSGDDPNFLEWIGWIRDELGENHSPIYLVGLLSLSNVDRALLTRRGVTPIDLSSVQGDRTHSEMIEWFLRSLQAADSPRPESWLDARSVQENIGIGLSAFERQEDEPARIDGLVNSPHEIDEVTSIKIIARWRYERLNYPGWLVPTDEIRSSLIRKTYPYIAKLVNVAQDWPHEDQVLLYREILWRVETSLLPLESDLAESFETSIKELFPLVSSGSRPIPSDKMSDHVEIPRSDVSDSWLEVSIALLRNARESFDETRWEELKQRITQVVRHHPQFSDRYYYEQALWLLWNLKRDEAQNLLTQWSPSPHAPLAMMWKAGILAELDGWSESHSLLRTALKEIQESYHKTQELNIDLLSLEGWCSFLLRPVEFNIKFLNPLNYPQNQEDNTNSPDEDEKFLKRWNELKAFDADPWLYTEYFKKILSGEPPATGHAKQIVTGFDLGQYTIRHSLPGESTAKWLPAFSYLRLHEKVGIPLRFSGETLRNAAEWLAAFSNFWSPMILIRAGNTKDMKESDYANRVQIASMDPDLAHRLNIWAMNALIQGLSTVGNRIPMQSAQTSLLETLIEFLSRLTLKSDQQELHAAFRTALRIHNLPGIKTHIRLNESCAAWFRRLYDAADNQQLLEWIPALIRFPLSENTNDVNGEHERHPAITWPDPMADLDSDLIEIKQNTDSDLKVRIRDAVEWLLLNTRMLSGEPRQRALVRLFILFHAEAMTDDQEERFGELLWEDRIESGLPDVPQLSMFNFLHLPSPPGVETKSRLKQHLLSLKPVKMVKRDHGSLNINFSAEQEDQMIREVSFATKTIARLPSEPKGEIEWELTEMVQLWNDVHEWWENDRHALRPAQPFWFTGGTENYFQRTLERVGMFLSRVLLPHMESSSEEDWNRILLFLSATRQDNTFLTPALPYLLLHRPDEFEMVKNTILDDLSSNDKQAVAAAAKAVAHWANLEKKISINEMPPEAVNDLIARVVFRQPEGINHCLIYLTILIRHMGDFFGYSQMELISSSLIPWNHVTKIPGPEDNLDGFPEHDRPLLRSLVGQLASALSDWWGENCPDKPEPTGISTWREICASDPLPEVRRSFNNNQPT